MIHRLSEETINQIAAGEVVENPASVVKEFVENSVDARAQEITIEIEGGGFSRIRIVDDGCGMSPEDALLAVERHATSKIASAADLETLSTMGFRGEALASIAAVSRLTLTTSVENGYRVEVEGGKLVKHGPYARARGTTVDAVSLFYNVPARKKFQKSPAASLAEIHRTVAILSLAHPEKTFRLIHEGEPLLEAFASTLEKRARDLFGDTFFSAKPIIHPRFSGLLGSPDETRPNRLAQYLFINRRPVVCPAISFAVKDAYGTRIDANRHPVFILHLQIPGSTVDVNVHPQKREVRLRDEPILKQEIREAVAASLGDKIVLSEPSWTPPQELSAPALRFREESQSHPVFEETPIVFGLFAHFLFLLENGSLRVIDLQAVRERVIFDALASKAPSAGQGLLIPISVHLSPEESQLLQERLPEIQRIGFSLHPIGKTAWAIEAIPSFLDADEASDALRAALEGEIPRKLAQLARTKKTTFMLQEALALYKSPHGKVGIVEWNSDDLQKFF